MTDSRPNGAGQTRGTVETAFSVLLLLSSIGFLWFTTEIPDPPRNVAIGPRTFPYAVGTLMVLLSTVLVWRCLRPVPHSLTEVAPSSGLVVPTEEERPESIEDWRAIWVVLGALLLLFLLLEPIGFVPAMTLFVFGLSTFFGPSRWLWNLVVALCFSASFYLLFTGVLGIQLPKGPLISLME